jgi:hypothetical protein
LGRRIPEGCSSQSAQGFLEIDRQRCGEQAGLALIRQTKFQSGGVEELSPNGQAGRSSAVDSIPHDGATQKLQMDPDLMGSSGQGHDLK